MMADSTPLPWNSGVMPKMMPKMRSHDLRTFRSHISRSFCRKPNLPLNLPIRRFRSGTVMKNPIGSSLK